MDRVIVPWEGWEIVKAIGQGSFGKVYEIRREAFGFTESAAMKVLSIPVNEDETEYLRAEGMDDESISQTFHGHVADIVREYRLMQYLRNSANIVHCDDYKVLQKSHELGYQVYIKMELLTPLMNSLKSITGEEQIINLAIDLCKALVDCQRHNILHRDIKPANIFKAPDGTYKLGDFGIAKNLERTTLGTVGVGTYGYMAPEVLRGDPYGPQADIYSLGMVVYWLLNRRRLPFLPLPPQSYTAAMSEEARRKRFRGDPIPAPADGSAKLKQIVLKACAFDSKVRYSSASELLEALLDLNTVGNAGLEMEELTVITEKPVRYEQEGDAEPIYADSTDYNDEDYEDLGDIRLTRENFREVMEMVFSSRKFQIGLGIAVICAIGLVVGVLLFFCHFVNSL